MFVRKATTDTSVLLHRETIQKHGSHDQKTHGGGRGSRAHPEHGGGAQRVFEALPQKIDSMTNKINTEFKATNDMGVASELSTAKTYLTAAGKAKGAKSAASSIANARLRVMSAARKMSSKSLPKSIRISDIADELEALYTGLMMPAGG